MIDDAPDVMGVADAAKMLGLHVESMRRIIRREKGFPAVKIGREYQMSKSKVLEFYGLDDFKSKSGGDLIGGNNNE